MHNQLSGFEEWRPVAGYQNYHVSNRGRIFNTRTNQLIRPYQAHHFQAPRVTLSHNGNIRSFYVHRIVAEAFLAAWEPIKDVEFIDGDNTNAAVTNLRFKNRLSIGGYNKGVRTVQARWLIATNVATREIYRFHSVAEAREILGVENRYIYAVLTGKQRTAGGWHFEWEWTDTELEVYDSVWAGD